MSLAVLFVRNTHNCFTLLEQTGDSGLFKDLNTVWLRDSEVLKAFELSIGDNHAGELGIATVGARLRVATEAGNLGEIKIKLFLEPVDSIARAVGEHVDKIVPRQIACL